MKRDDDTRIQAGWEAAPAALLLVGFDYVLLAVTSRWQRWQLLNFGWWIWQQVNTRLRRIIRALERGTNRDALQQARDLLVQLTRARRQAGFLDDVRLPSHVATNVTMVLLKRPTYRALFEGQTAAQRFRPAGGAAKLATATHAGAPRPISQRMRRTTPPDPRRHQCVASACITADPFECAHARSTVTESLRGPADPFLSARPRFDRV